MGLDDLERPDFGVEDYTEPKVDKVDTVAAAEKFASTCGWIFAGTVALSASSTFAALSYVLWHWAVNK